MTAKVADLETTVNGNGGSNPGLSADVAQLKDEVETASTGLMDQVTALRTEIGTPPTGASDINTRVEQNTSDIADLKTTAAAAYKFQGSLTPAQVSTWQTDAASGLFKNGYVWDCSDALTINFNGTRYEFAKGTNFAYVGANPPDSNTKLDELGMNIDTTKIENDIKALQGKFVTEPEESGQLITSWDSTNLKNGTYLITGYQTLGSATTQFAFIASFNSVGGSLTSTPIDLSQNFSSFFRQDPTTAKFELKSLVTLSQLNTLKLS